MSETADAGVAQGIVPAAPALLHDDRARRVMTTERNSLRTPSVSTGMNTTAEIGGRDESLVVRLDPGAWWGLVAAALLVLAFLVGPILVLALGDDLDHEVPSLPDPAAAEATRPAPPGATGE